MLLKQNFDFTVQKTSLNAAFKDVYQKYCLINIICLPIFFIIIIFFFVKQQKMYGHGFKKAYMLAKTQ